MNLSEIRTQILVELQASVNNCVFSTATINNLINQKYMLLMRRRLWSFLLKEATVSTVYTTVSATSTSTTLNATSVAGMSVGRKLVVSDGTNFEEVYISSISGTIITLTGTGLSESYAADSYIFVDNYFLPSDCWKVLSVKDFSVPRNLDIRRTATVDRELTQRKSYGDPRVIYIAGTNLMREPASGTYAMDTSSSTTSVIETQLTGTTTDYYKGWTCFNVTRDLSATVSAYNASTKTLTLESAITAQVATDTFYLIPRLTEFFLYPLANTSRALNFRYKLLPEKLLNNRDVPIMPDAYHMLLVYEVMVALATADRYNKRAGTNIGTYAALSSDLYNQMVDDYSILAEGASECMVTGDEDQDDQI